MKKLILGTSGFSYPDWKGPFYPKSLKESKMLSYYANQFNSVEINSSFYRLPKKNDCVRWVKITPKDFIFSAKLPRLITHEKYLDDPNGQLTLEFLKRISPIVDSKKLGAILIQLRPKFSSQYLNSLESYMNTLRSNQWLGRIRFVVEFRHKSWENEKRAFKLLESYGIACCQVDEPLMKADLPITANYSYIRWHGRNIEESQQWYNYKYSREQLEAWVPRIEKMLDETSQLYGYFNNHPRGQAIENLRMLAEILGIPFKKSGIESYF